MNTTLITGGTGKTGRRVAHRLTSIGHDVRLGSRSGVPPFDWADPRSWGPALNGCTSAYLTFAPDLAMPGAPETVARFARTAVDRGASRLVLLSGRGEEGAQLAENLVAASGAEWTVVRCAFFAQNFSESLWTESIRAGELVLPGNAPEPLVDVEDVADVVALALTQDGHEGQVYECTGPRLLRFDEVVAEIARATGRSVSFREGSIAEFADSLSSAGMPAQDAAGFAELFGGLLDGHNAEVADGVPRALGRPPRAFTDYVRRTAATGVWDV